MHCFPNFNIALHEDSRCINQNVKHIFYYIKVLIVMCIIINENFKLFQSCKMYLNIIREAIAAVTYERRHMRLLLLIYYQPVTIGG